MEDWRSKILLRFSDNEKDAWTIDDAMKGTSVLGGTGSGKTSASGKTIAMQFLKEGWGGIVLCAKTDEAQLWFDYCKKAKRLDDVIWFKKGAVHQSGDHKGKKIVFNPLHYEMTRTGEGAKEAFNITNIFMNMYKMGNRITHDTESTKGERFWDSALKRILNRTIELINLAGEELTYANMINLIYSAPTEKQPFDKNLWANFIQMVEYEDDDDDERENEDEEENRQALKSNYFMKCLAKAYKVIENEDDDYETSQEYKTYDLIHKYFTSSLPYMSEHTHNAVIESFMGLAEPFLAGILAEHFAGETTLYPEETYLHKKIILLDFSVKEFLEAGIMAQSIFKMIFQQALERRDTAKNPIPVFLWADEAHYYVNPYDQIFLTTARSSRTATVFLSQNISNYQAAIGGEKSMPQVNSLMGNLATKIFHANSDFISNDYASNLIGQSISFTSDRSSQSTFMSFSFNSTKGLRAQYLPQVQPKEFTILKSGGEANNFEVEGYVFVTGKQWSNGSNFLKTIFEQKFDKKET